MQLRNQPPRKRSIGFGELGQDAVWDSDEHVAAAAAKRSVYLFQAQLAILRFEQEAQSQKEDSTHVAGMAGTTFGATELAGGAETVEAPDFAGDLLALSLGVVAQVVDVRDCDFFVLGDVDDGVDDPDVGGFAVGPACIGDTCVVDECHVEADAALVAVGTVAVAIVLVDADDFVRRGAASVTEGVKFGALSSGHGGESTVDFRARQVL